MKVLVYGAGVIGCYLAHILTVAGHEVTLQARGTWKNSLGENGLVIRHPLQRKTTTDHPALTDVVVPAGHFDAVFAVMQYQQLLPVLDCLAALDTPLLVLVGNNMSAARMEQHILQASKMPKTVLFGFQGTAGQRENGVVHCARIGAGSMSLGGLHREADEVSKSVFAQLFEGTKYRLTWVSDMDGWYKTHLTLILPVVYVCYAVGCDLRKAAGTQRRLILDAAGEADGLLKKLNIPVLPTGDELYYQPGFKRWMMSALLFIASKTMLGELMASDHARHAVSEMQELDTAFMAMRAQAPAFPMPAFDTLRGAMPPWEELYGKEKQR